MRTNFNSHGVKILSVSEEGNIDFLVYGYMNRGNHEGTTGVALTGMRMGIIHSQERLSICLSAKITGACAPGYRTAELPEQQSDPLSSDGSCSLWGGAVGKEYMVVADGLTEENFAVSADGSRIAWQDGSDIYSSEKLNVMDLKTGKKDEIRFQDQTVIRLVGFVGSDRLRSGESVADDRRPHYRFALYALEIVGSTMETGDAL